VRNNPVLLVFLAIVACGGACGSGAGSAAVQTPASLPAVEPNVRLEELQPYFVAGEQITWEVSYLGMQGGRARLAVGTPGLVEGKRMISVVAEAESAGIFAAIKRVRDSVSSWIDVGSGLPWKTISIVEMKGKMLEVKAVRRDGEPIADLQVKREGKESKETKHLPSLQTHDPVSAILVLRSWNAPLGSRGAFNTLGGLRVWRTDVVVEAREEIGCPFGKRQAVRISGVSRRMVGGHPDKRHKPRSFTMWMSEDAQRIPLRIVAKTEYGEIEVLATSYEAPVVGRR
jgi:hypothetical protein